MLTDGNPTLETYIGGGSCEPEIEFFGSNKSDGGNRFRNFRAPIIKDANLSEWARLRVAQLHCSGVGIRLHRAELLRRGEPPAKIEELSDWQECGQFTDLEKLALALAEALTLRPSSDSCRMLLHCARDVLPRHTFIDLVIVIESVNEWNLDGGD